MICSQCGGFGCHHCNKQINQCDGCMRGLPKDTWGHHIDSTTFGLMCTANRYTTTYIKYSNNTK